MASSTREGLVKRIRDEYTEERGVARSESERKKYMLYAEIPQLREVDAQLAATAGLIMRAAVGGGDVEDKISAIRHENESLREKRRAILRENGYPEDYTDVKYICEKCKDTGFVGIEMCSCFKTKLSKAMLDASGLGRLCEEQNFDTFSLDYYTGADRAYLEKMVADLKKYAAEFSHETADSWIFVGNTGLGKTHLSTAIAAEVIKRGYEVCYEPMQTVVDNFADCQFRGEGRDSVRKYNDCDLLIIDDLGTELVNQFTVSCLYNILNYRINNKKPVIISTNLSGEEIRNKYDDRITSRIFGYFHAIKFEGKDIRRQKLGGKK